MKKYLLVGIMILAGGVAKAQYPAGIWFTEHSLNMLFSQDSDNQGGVVGVEDSLKVGWDGSIWRTIFTREDTSLYLPDLPGSGGTLGISSTGGVYEMAGGGSFLKLDQTTPETVSGGPPNFSGGVNVDNDFAVNTNGEFSEYGNEVPSRHDVLVGDGTQLKMRFDPEKLFPNYGFYVHTSFTGNFGGTIGFATATSGAGATNITATGGTIPEFVTGSNQLTTGTTSTGQSASYTVTWVLTGGVQVYECFMAINDSAIAAEDYYVVAGFHDYVNNKDAIDGIYFKYDRSVNNQKWICTWAKNGVVTDYNSSKVITEKDGIYLRIEVNSSLTEAKYYVDNSLVYTATLPTAIPTSALMHRIKKTNGSTSRTLFANYVWAYKILNTPRTSTGFETISGY